MPRPKSDPKADTLRKQGCLHPHPDKVTDEAFAAGEFFDPRDLVQVKYEMLRRVRVDGQAISHAATGFGLSRPTYYQALAAYEEGGLPALLPKKPGPRRAHKLSDEVVAALKEALATQPELDPQDLVKLVEERFGISVHRRSIERALARQEKNGNDRRPHAAPGERAERARACQALRGPTRLRRAALRSGRP